MKQVIIIKEEIKEPTMSDQYYQLLKGLKKSEIFDVISNLEKKFPLSEDYKSPSTNTKKETLIETALDLIKENEKSAEWASAIKEIPFLEVLDVPETEDKIEISEAEEDAEEEHEGCNCVGTAEECICDNCACDGCACKGDHEVKVCGCGEGPEDCTCEDCQCSACDEEEEEGDCCEDSCCYSYEPTLKERIQWKIYDFRWFLLLKNEALKIFCTSVSGLFKITTFIELVTLFTFVYQHFNTLVHCPNVTKHISNLHVLSALKVLEILFGYAAIFIGVPLIISYYFNFLPEPVVESDDEEDEEDDYDDELYASDSDDEEYDEFVAPSDDEEDDEEEANEEIEEIEEKDASQEGEDVNELLLNEDDEDYDYEDLDSEYLDDSDVEDDFDYEDYPNLTLVDDPEKDSYDPFTYSLAKVAVAYICLRFGVGLCEFNNLVVLSKLCEVVIGFGIVGALIGLYN